MVALFFWRNCQSPPVAVAPSPSASAAIVAARAPHEDPVDIPPPPAIPDAAPDTGHAKTPVASTGGGDNCGAATCGGNVSTELSNALAFRARTAHKCYDEALAQDSTLKGQVVIAVRVGSNGNVCSAAVQSSDLANPGVAPCIANRFRQGARLPAPTGGCAEVNVPMRLLPPH
jgi:outer membrane biosynthesis protein TonB